MKKLSPFLVLLVGVTGALAQTVSFRNTDAFETATTNSTSGFTDRLVRLQGGTPVVGTQYRAQLFFGAVGGSLNPVTSNPVSFRDPANPGTVGLEGTWSGATRTLTGFTAGQTVVLQVRAWDATGGATFDTTAIRGQSATFLYTIPAAGSPPSDFYMEGFGGFTIVPEPSVIGLALVGAGALFMLRRRK
jgi:hypothetical protein